MATPQRWISTLAGLVCSLLQYGTAHAADPPLPPGVDPGGTPVALITTGIDYTDPLISNRLARDGEGQLISWDFVDNDNTPFANQPGATSLAKLLLETDAKARLIIARVDPTNPKHLARAAAFIARTPARIAAVPIASENQTTWTFFTQVAEKATNTLFVVSAGTPKQIANATPKWPAAAKLENSVVAASLEPFVAMIRKRSAEFAKLDRRIDAWLVPIGLLVSDEVIPQPPHTSQQAVAMLAAHAACLMRNDPTLHGAKTLRAALLAQKHPHPNRPEIKVLKPNCQNGAPTTAK